MIACMSIWFTADEHYGHANIIRHCNRPFADAAEMERELVRRHNILLGAGDAVYHVRDFVWGSVKDGMISRVLGQLNGEHHLIVGNHDRCSPVHRRWKRWVPRYIEEGFASVSTVSSFNIREFGGSVTAYHFPPMEAAGVDDRYAEHRLRDVDGAMPFLICGHVHDRWLVRDFPEFGCPAVNVGVDRWAFAPVSVGEIADAVQRHRLKPG